MVHIEYTGNKPTISFTGVSFEGKQDKYNFIEPSARVIDKLLNLKSMTTIKKSDFKKSADKDEVLEVLYTLIPEFDEFYEEQLENYKQKLDLEEKEVKENRQLNYLEKRALQNNYKYMRDYRIQRATNKLVYEEMINRAVKLIKEKEIKNIQTPLSMHFLHVLESLKTTMDKEKVALSSHINVKLEKKDSYAELSFT